MHKYDSFDPKIISSLAKGEVGILPTDTIYGVVCAANNKNSVARLYKLKERTDKPGTVIAANIDQLEKLGLKRRYLKAVEEYWPGPVSILIPCSLDLNYITINTMLLAVRIPDDAKLISLLEKTGPLLTSSANKTGQPTLVNIDEATKVFGDKVDFYVDGGDYSDKEPSAVIRIIDDTVEVLRPGNRFKK